MAIESRGLTQNVGQLHQAKSVSVSAKDVAAWARATGVPVETALKSLREFEADEFQLTSRTAAAVVVDGKPYTSAPGTPASKIPYADAVAPHDGQDQIDVVKVANEIRDVMRMPFGERAKAVLSYDAIRFAMFTALYNHAGVVTCVYTNRELKTDRIPNGADMNTEHTWPQSKGAKGAAKSDGNHLFVTDSEANARRGSHPFGKVEKVLWEKDGCKLGLDARGETCFEPPDSHKGNVRRALQHFSATYELPIPAAEDAATQGWASLDPVDASELAVSWALRDDLQGFGNTFVETAPVSEQITSDATKRLEEIRSRLKTTLEVSMFFENPENMPRAA